MLRIALLGSTGYIGGRFAAEIGRRGHVCLPIRRGETDVYDAAALARCLETLAADFLINCAGYTGKPNVDACESHKTECLAANAVLPGVIAAACRRLGLPWGHISSGCIYTGERPGGGGFTEDDDPNFTFRQNNCSFYSGTKALGEEVLADAERCYIWRLRIPFCEVDGPRNYLSKLLRYERLLDAANSLSYLPEFVAACLDSCERRLPFGAYNLTNPGSLTTREVTAAIRRAGLTDKEFAFFASEREFMQQAALTPRSNCVLDSSKALRAGLELTPAPEAITRALSGMAAASHEQRAASSERFHLSSLARN